MRIIQNHYWNSWHNFFSFLFPKEISLHIFFSIFFCNRKIAIKNILEFWNQGRIFPFFYQLHTWQGVNFRILFLWKDVLTCLHKCPENHSFSTKCKVFLLSWNDSFSQLSKEVRLLCWDSRKSKQRKWSDVFQKIQVDINFILICGTKLRTFKQKVRPQWILLWCIFMWKKLGTNLLTPWKIYV